MRDTSIRAALGSRHDPHRQAREAREAPLLLHSLATHREVLDVVFHHSRPSTVVEVGVESGQVSTAYLDLGADRVYGVDPCPDDGVRERFAERADLHLVEQPSPHALASIPAGDLYVIDGDHNYAVVRGELAWILENAPDAVVVLHDVLWPCARRDLYYEPTDLADHDLHPRSDEGPTVWHDRLSSAGFVGLGAFTAALEAGGERNGVLTAVEDALDGGPGRWDLHIVPAVFGLAIVVPRSSAFAVTLARDLALWTESRLLLAMENNRVALYTRVLELQHREATSATDLDVMAETIASQQIEIDRLRAELASGSTADPPLV